MSNTYMVMNWVVQKQRSSRQKNNIFAMTKDLAGPKFGLYIELNDYFNVFANTYNASGFLMEESMCANSRSAVLARV